MKRKIAVNISLIGLVGAIVFLGYTKYIEFTKSMANPLNAIPTNAAIIIKTDNWLKSWSELEASDIWQQISKNDKWKNIKNEITNTKKTIEASEVLNKILDNQVVYLSIHSTTQGFDILLSTAFQGENPLDLLKTHFISQKLNSKDYDGVDLFELENGWNLCIHKGIVFFSSSHLLVENSIRQLNNKLSLLNSPTFNRVRQTESTFANAHIYLNYHEFSKLLKQNIVLNKKQEQQIGRWAEWAELDLKIKNNSLIFSGFTLAQDSSNNFLNTLSGQKPQTILMDAIIPSNTQKMGILGMNDFRCFYEKYTDFLAKHNNLYEHNKWIQEKNKDYGIQLENTFAAIIGNELGYINTFTSSGNSENYVVIQSDSDAVEMLKHLNKNITENPFNSTHRGFQLYKLYIPNVLQRLIGNLFSAVNENYFCWIDGYLVFANSPTALKTFINSNLSRKTLANNIYYQNYTENISSKCNYLFYSNPSLNNWTSNLYKNLQNWVDIKDWSNINAFAYQLTTNNELFYNSAVLHYEPNIRDESQLLWSVSLGNTFNMQPQFITNHYTKLQEVLVQDDSKQLHLISTSGKTLWNKKIGGKILGKINQLDFYKNKKLQLIFNTADSLYVIDRNGNNVETFPKRLESKASAGHTLLDYDNNRKYRILIPSEDKMVYNYDKYGEIVKGWKFKKMPETITQELQYHLHKSKDFIYVVDQAGNAKIVGRNGKQRIQLGNLPLADTYHIDKQYGYVYSTDAQANVWLTDLEGKKSKIKSNNLTKPHHFIAQNINEDELTELIISEARLSCYQLEAKIFDYDASSDYPPRMFEHNDQHYIGITQGENFYLIKSNGNLFPGMPLYGQGSFNCTDTDKDGQLNLLIGSGDLLYNYSLE